MQLLYPLRVKPNLESSESGVGIDDTEQVIITINMDDSPLIKKKSLLIEGSQKEKSIQFQALRSAEKTSSSSKALRSGIWVCVILMQ